MKTLKRYADSNSGWNCLPEELMISIVRELAANGNMKAIASLRLVSKAWRAAVREHPVTFKDIRVTKWGDLRKLNKISHQISQLTIGCNQRKLNLCPLSSLTNLRSIGITGYRDDWSVKQQLYAGLSHLPGSLTELQLAFVELRSSSLRSLKITDLRVLTLQFSPYHSPNIWSLLQCLPNLEVLHLWGTRGSGLALLESLPLDSNEWCQNLTQLVFSDGRFEGWRTCKGPKGLQEVVFNNMQLTSGWLNTFTSTVASLKILQLDNCFLGNQGHLTPVSTLSSLLLRRVTLMDAQFELAADNLPSLSLQERDQFMSFVGRQEFMRLTGLTRLELIEQKDIESLEAIVGLSNMPLRELVFLNCKEIELKPLLFVPGALTTLTALHIEDARCSSYIAESLEPLPASKREELKRVGDAVFRLPQLQQLSGWCDLFVIGMKQGLKSWEKRPLPEGAMVTHKTDHKCALDWMKLWTKPQAE